MSKSTNPQCQLMQLQFDAYLDGELETARTAELNEHLASCKDCAQELAFAQELHRQVVSLPILDCSAETLEPIDRLFAGSASGSGRQVQVPGRGGKSGLIVGLDKWFTSWPSLVRVAVPLAATVVLAVGISRVIWQETPQNNPGFIVDGAGNLPANSPVPVSLPGSYSEEEIVQAFQDLQVALDYLGEVSERTGGMIEDRFLLRQLRETINASLDNEPVEAGTNGPI